MPEMTENQTPGRKPKKKKNKESHNAVERHRKEKINAGINRIGNLLPCSQALKQSKNMILDQAFRYITELKKQNDAFLLEGGDKVQAEEIRRLRRQLEELRKESNHYIELLKAHDINLLDDPTIHWKGKQRCAKVAKVTPTHQLPNKVVLSNGNVICQAVKQSSQGKQPSETLLSQPPSGPGQGVNGSLLQVNTSSSLPALLPASAATPTQSTSGLRVIEQCVVEPQPAAQTLPPSVSYITLQIPADATALPQQMQPNTSTQTSIAASSVSQHPTESVELPASKHPTSTQTIIGAVVTNSCQGAQDNAIKTVSYTAVPNNQTHLRVGAAGSTQTTWTTLQMAGNTVHPVCQSLPLPEVRTTSQAFQQVTVCPVGTKPAVHPVQIQMQPHVSAQQTPIAHIQAHPFKTGTQLQPAVLKKAQSQPVLTPQTQCAVLPETAIVPQTAVVTHPPIVSKPQSTVLQTASLVPHPSAALIPQPQTIPQPALVPQPHTAMLPLLPTMQVLQVNPAAAAASVVTAPQNTNNPSVVILQQANTCPAQPVVREESANQTPCQHIVIIHAPSQAASAPQGSQIGVVPSAVPAFSTPMSTSVSVPPVQCVGGKQLVHILPRPAQSQTNQSLQVSQSSSPLVPSTPQTITVNGQVFALQPVKTSDKAGSQGGQSTLQLVQPTTNEEPTTNVALNSLGALSNLNKSISQGLPLSNQSSIQSPPGPAVVGQLQPPVAATVTLPVQQLVASEQAGNATNATAKKTQVVLNPKKSVVKRTKSVKKKGFNPLQPTSTKSKAAGGESQTVQLLLSSSPKVTNIHAICTTAAPVTESTETACVSSSQISVCSSSSSTCLQNNNSVSNSVSCFKNNITNTSMGVCETPVKPSSSSVLPDENEPKSCSGENSTASKPPVSEVNQVPTSATNTRQSKSPITTLSKQNKCIVNLGQLSYISSASCSAQVCTGSVTVTASLNQNVSRNFQESEILYTQPCKRTESQSATLPSVSTPVGNSSSVSNCAVTVPATCSGFKKKATTSRAPSQQAGVTVAQPTISHPTEVNPLQTASTEGDAQEETPSITGGKEEFLAVTSSALSKKDFTPTQQIYTNLDDPAMEQTIPSCRQTDSPMSSGAGAGRGFSVASMLPQGQSISSASSSFSFTFTSEQAEILALAMLEQDSPGRRSGSCSGENGSLTNASTALWDSPKTPSVAAGKDRILMGQQAKMAKPVDPVAVKHAVEGSVRGQIGEGPACSSNGARHTQNISYSQPQALPQAQSHSVTQSGAAGSLSVNNLIRPSSSHQTYSGSPSLAVQQSSIPSPVGTSTHISQSLNNALSPCSGAAQVVEYTTLKSTPMRPQSGNVVGDRQVKIISKRQAQEEVMLNTGKRPKACPPAANVGSHIDVKASDHAQMSMGQLPSTSSAVMKRISSESGGPPFSSTPFMPASIRPSDGHCPAQGPSEQNTAGGAHLSQSHTQHPLSQPTQHLGGNIYMKQQQQEQQRHHLYHLQHHLTQPDPSQRHSLHQRAMQQQEQQQQHAQKKRGIVRVGQTGSPAGLQQKQHHLEKSVVHQHPLQQQSQHQQQSQQHPQQSLQQQSQHQQQAHQQAAQGQQLQHLQQQNSHSRHSQHLQQQIQQQQQHFRHQDKACEAQTVGSRPHHSSHLAQQDHLKPGQDHNAMQRMMGSRNLEQQMISPPTNAGSRSSELACAPSRQERHRVSNYSAEALIGKSSSNGEQQQRMALHLPSGRGTAQEQQDLRGYLDTSRGKAGIAHNQQNRLPSDHQASGDVQRVSECQPFKAMAGGGGGRQLGGFEAQVSRGSEMAPKSVPPSQRVPQGQQQGGFRMSVGPTADGRNRGGYGGPHPGPQGVQVGPVLPREQDGCNQSFMQSLLSPHLPEQGSHQRAVQCCPPEYSCVPGSSSAEIQAKASSPNVPPSQKPQAMRLIEASKGHISQVGSNMHTGPGVRAAGPHPAPPHSSSEAGRSSAISRPPPAVSQHSRHIPRDPQPAKLRPSDRPRSGALRPTNPFEPEGHLPLPSGGGVLLGRPQSGGEARRSTIVRFMADSSQVPGDNNIVSEQHLTQNFGFPFIPEGGMNPPPPINANSTFIPPVSQPSTSRTPSLLPVEPQNTLPSFYPSYSPAAHPSLPSDVTLQYFPNQMFTSPSTDKSSAPQLNNRFGSILSPPRPVGFGQASFPLLPEIPPMPSSGITPHISNFSLTSLFPEIATGMPTDGSAMPMSPLLSLSNASSGDSGKQPNRPAHNISHILGHDGSSAV